MEKITMKAYAVQHKVSLFNVIKMVKSGKLKSTVVLDGDKEVTYVLLDKMDKRERKDTPLDTNIKNEIDLKKEVLKLREEVAYLKKEIETLKNRL